MDSALAFGELLFTKKNSKLPYIIIICFIVLLTALIIFYCFFGCIVVTGHSMEKTINDKQRTLILKTAFDIERGDVVTIEHPEKEDEMLIKRVIALSGDKVLFVRTANNRYIDMYICKKGDKHFKLKTEKYIAEQMQYNSDKFIDKKGNAVPTSAYYEREFIENIDISATDQTTVTSMILGCAISIPDNHFYYLGDNRNFSSDSRYYGTSNIDKITGKVIKIIERGSALDNFIQFMFAGFSPR